MSQIWKRRGLGVFRPQLLDLEDRTVPAGNVTAFVDGGILEIRADNDGLSHAFSVSGCGRQSVMLRSIDNTTINGSFENLWLGDIEHGFDIRLGDGGGTAIITGCNINESLNLVGGAGKDYFHIVGGTHVGVETFIAGNGGDDFLRVSDSDLGRHVVIDMGDGDDRVNLSNNRVQPDTNVSGGSGNNVAGSTGNSQQPKLANFSNTFAFELPQAEGDVLNLGGGTSGTVRVLDNDTALQGTLDPASVKIVRAPAAGSATVNGDGSIAYTASGTGDDSFTYTVMNTAGGLSNEATVSVRHGGATSPPTVPPTVPPTAPTTTLSTTAANPTNVNPIPFTVSFSADVTGFAKTDISVTGGTASDVTASSGSQYSFTVAPSGDGAVTVSIAAGAASDSAGTATAASNVITRTFDSTAPTVTANALTTNKTTPSLTGTVNDSAATVVVTVNGVTTTATVSGTNWTATPATAIPDGTYTISVTATDKAGNVGSATSTNGLIIDTVAPTATVASTLASPTNSTSIPVTVTFSEVVSGFASTDLTVTNGSVNTFGSTDNKTFTFNVVPTTDGNVTVLVPAGSATDAAGNANVVSNTFSITFNSNLPSVTLSTTVTDPTNVTPFTVQAKFSKDVTGFTLSDVQVTNGTASNFIAADGSTYTFSVTPTSNGLVTVNVPAGVAVTVSNDPNTAATPLTRTFDNIAPTATISSTLTSPTTTNPIRVTIAFSESVTGFTSSDLTVTNGSAGVVNTVDNKTIVINIVPAGSGTVTVVLPAGSVQDAAGNGNTVSNSFSIVFTNGEPAVTLTSPANDPVNAPFTVTATFDQDVTGFTESDIAVVNGATSNFSATDAKTYTFLVTPATDGTVTVNVPGNSAVNGSNMGNLAAIPLIRTFDATPPTTTIDAQTTANTTPTITGTVSEAGTTITVTVNGEVVDAVVTNLSWSATLTTPLADGSYTIDLTATDAAGNQSTNSLPNGLVVESLAPTVAITSSLTSPTNATTIPVTVTFSEAVTGFDDTDPVVVNGTLSNFFANANGVTYTFDVTPTVDGTVSVNIPAAAGQSLTGHDSLAAPEFTIVSDRTPPTTTIDAQTTANSTPTITGTVSEAGTTITVTVNGEVVDAVVTNLSWSATLTTPLADGSYTIDLTATDAAGNQSTNSLPNGLVVESLAPTVAITSSLTSPTNATTIPVTVTFSEVVTGFDDTDPVVVNGTLSKFFANADGVTYTFDVTPTVDGTVSVNIPAAAGQSLTGHDSLAAPEFTIVSDRTPPTTTIDAQTTANTTPTITGTVSETGTTITVTVNGEVVDAVVTNLSWSATLTTQLSDGSYTIDLTATDAAGNQSTNSLPNGLIVDSSAPSAAITSNLTSPTNADVIPIRVTFSEVVTGFDASDPVVDNGTVSNFTASVDGKTYAFDVTPTADGTVSVNVPAGAAMDLTGHDSKAAATFTIVSDRTPPSTLLDYSGQNPTNQPTVTVSITFGEAVTGFTIGDIDVSNATLSNLKMINPKVYTVDVSPITAGSVSISVPAGSATDAAGNGNETGLAINIEYDTIPPTGTINTVATTAITGTADGTISAVTSLQISIFDGSLYWDGTAFTGASEILLDVQSIDGFQNWSYDFSTLGSYTVTAHITDQVGLTADPSATVVVG